jgi:hypothetical protein
LWRQRLRDFSGSQVTVDEFCGQLGVTTATFYYWRKKVVEAGGSSGVLASSVSSSRKPGSCSVSRRPRKQKTSGSFIPVRIEPSMAAGGDVAIRLPSGAQMRIPVSAPEVIAAVVAQVADLRADGGIA